MAPRPAGALAAVTRAALRAVGRAEAAGAAIIAGEAKVTALITYVFARRRRGDVCRREGGNRDGVDTRRIVASFPTTR